MNSSKKDSNFKKTHKRAGVYAIVLGIFLIILFYYQSMDGLITAGHLTGSKHIVSQIKNPSEFRKGMLVRYGLALAFIIMGIIRLRKFK